MYPVISPDVFVGFNPYFAPSRGLRFLLFRHFHRCISILSLFFACLSPCCQIAVGSIRRFYEVPPLQAVDSPSSSLLQHLSLLFGDDCYSTFVYYLPTKPRSPLHIRLALFLRFLIFPCPRFFFPRQSSARGWAKGLLAFLPCSDNAFPHFHFFPLNASPFHNDFTSSSSVAPF